MADKEAHEQGALSTSPHHQGAILGRWQPKQRDYKDCATCHLTGGTIITLAGLYSLFGAYKGHDMWGQKVQSKVWLGLVGGSLCVGGLYYLSEPWIKPYFAAKHPVHSKD